jgi:hypothetical protein
MKFESKKAGGKEWQGNRLIWNIWDDEERKKPTHIANLKYSGEDLTVTSFRIGNIEYLFFNEVPLSLFADNLCLFHYIPQGTYISLECKTPPTNTEVWWELED